MARKWKAMILFYSNMVVGMIRRIMGLTNMNSLTRQRHSLKTHLEHPNDDSNPVIFKIRNATLLDWSLTANGKEEIWFDRAPDITLKKDRSEKESMTRTKWKYSNFYPR